MAKKERRIFWRQFIKESSFIALCSIALYGVSLLCGAERLAHAGSPSERRIPVQHIMTNPEGYNATMWEMCALAKETWERELGLTFKIDVRDHDEVLTKGLYGGQFEVMIMEYGGKVTRLDPGFILPLRFYASCDPYYPRIPKEECPGGGGAFNGGGYYSPEVNKLMDDLEKVFDYKERKKISDKILEITVRDVATLVVYSPYVLQLMNKKNWEGELPIVGEGLSSFWNVIGIKPKDKAKTLKAASVQAIGTINPMAIMTTQDYEVCNLMYDRLMRIDRKGKPINWMAEEVKAEDSPKGPNTVILIKLRKDLKFHDGVPVTADDVKFTFDFAKKYNAPDLATYLRRIDHVEKEGKYVVKIYLNSPWAGISHVLFSRMLIIPKHIWEKVPEKMTNPINWSNPRPIGSGPYKFSSWEKASQLVLNKFNDYFYPTGPERIVRVRYETSELLAVAIERGEIDVQWSTHMPSNIALRAEKKKDVKLVKSPNHGHLVFDLRLDKRPYNDRVFRKALEYSLPRQQMIDRCYGGLAQYIVSTIPSANKAWHNPKVFDIAAEYNPEKGRQILKKAGYEWDSEGHLCYPK